LPRKKRNIYHFIFAPAQSDFWFREWVAWYTALYTLEIGRRLFFSTRFGRRVSGWLLSGRSPDEMAMRDQLAKDKIQSLKEGVFGVDEFFSLNMFLDGIVDERNPANRLRLVVYPIIVQGFIHSGGCLRCLPPTVF